VTRCSACRSVPRPSSETDAQPRSGEGVRTDPDAPFGGVPPGSDPPRRSPIPLTGHGAWSYASGTAGGDDGSQSSDVVGSQSWDHYEVGQG
jgi:hypothetical protein